MSHPVIYLFCEDRSSETVCFKIQDDLAAELDVQLIRSGGVRGMRAFKNGFLERIGKSTYKGYLIFRDRDFDAEIPEQIELTNTKDKNGIVSKNEFMSHRVTIENYLIDANSIVQYLACVNQEIELVTIKQCLRTAAREIVSYSAVRHALGAVRKPLSIETTWTSGSGTLPQDLTDKSCQAEAEKLMMSFQDDASSIQISELNRKYLLFKSKFDEAFLDREEFLVWFNGKDLMTALQKQFHAIDLMDFSPKRYYEFVLKNLDYSVFNDLVQLKEEIRKLAIAT